MSRVRYLLPGIGLGQDRTGQLVVVVVTTKSLCSKIETGTEKTTIVDIFDIFRTVRNNCVHLKSRGGSHKEVRGKLVGMVPTCATCQGYGSQILPMQSEKSRGPHI